MLKSLLLSTFVIACSVLSAASQTQPPASQSHPQTAKPEERTTQSGPGFIAPPEVNVRVDADVRTFVVMAALNVAGFDYEPGGQPLSPARAELRRDLGKLDPAVRDKLAAFYKSHRREGVDEGADAARYQALSLLMTPPPAFSIYQAGEGSLPEDLRPLAEFVPLLQDFYVKSNIRALIPKYTAVANAYANAYRHPVGELIYRTLEYFHAAPETVIRMRPYVVNRGESAGAAKPDDPIVYARIRTRQVFIIPDPLAPLGSALVRGDILNQKDELIARRVGDDYIVVLGPSRTVNLRPIREALIRFVIDPMIERHLKGALQYKDDITKLVAGVPAAAKEYRSSVYLIVRESLARATDARMRRIEAAEAHTSYTEDDAVYDLAQAYSAGAVLAFHFYASLQGLEKVGISIEDFFDQMLDTTKFDREGGRPKEFEPIVSRVIAARRARASSPESGEPSPEAEKNPLGAKILQTDDLIRQRRFAEARPILEDILKQQPNHARALYGMAQVVSQVPSTPESDAKADENDKIQAQHDRLELASKLFHKAISAASAESEAWLIQWSHVLLGRILDFQEFRADAIAEYDQAIALGRIANGAYDEALEGKRRPWGQK